MKIYNSLTKRKEKFKPIENNNIRMYVCGMTVYSDAHIGHARTYFAFDLIRRYFEYKGFKVTYVQNITDVDDKIIDAANNKGVSALEYSEYFTERCMKDLDNLGIRRADYYPKASESISDIIKMIKQILDNGYGYISKGDVYFSVEKFHNYGKLSGQNINDLMSGIRINQSEKKRNAYDFALWKKAKMGEPSWNSPWGNGRPGWHIECSTMSSNILGLPFDIHGGGMDLRFPHHENEIAQAVAATDKEFAKIWMHIGLLTIEGEKMSKSIGNIININDVISKWDPEVVRFFFSQTHYRSPPDFSEKALKNAKKGLERIYRVKEKLESMCKDIKIEDFNKNNLSKNDYEYFQNIQDFIKKFEQSMDDDFNTPQTVSILFDFVNKTNKYFSNNSFINKNLCAYSLKILIKLGNILTLFQETNGNKLEKHQIVLDKLKKLVNFYGKKNKSENIEDLIEVLLNIRKDARLNKNWIISDEIRKKLMDIGIEIQDTSNGTIWRIM
jgi:cysteinyl-tRNA synthetase